MGHVTASHPAKVLQPDHVNAVAAAHRDGRRNEEAP
jgi:hypothetical protein